MRYTTNYLNRPELLTASLPDAQRAEQIVKTFIRSGGIADSTVSTSSATVEYKRLQGTELVEALSFSDADFIRISLNRYPIDGMFQMFTPNGQGTIEAIVAGGLNNIDAVVDFTSNFHPKDETPVHTYPIRTATQAWSILQAGEGFIARYKPDIANSPDERQTAIVRSVTLGYFDHFEYQPYLQPVYVFQGDDEFLGYVPAIDPRFFEISTTTE